MAVVTVAPVSAPSLITSTPPIVSDFTPSGELIVKVPVPFSAVLSGFEPNDSALSITATSPPSALPVRSVMVGW